MAGTVKGAPRRALQVLILTAAAAALAVPLLAVLDRSLPGVDALWKAQRLTGLYAFTLAFFNVVTGSMGIPIYRVFRPRLVMQVHRAFGITVVALAVVHGGIGVARGFTGYSKLWVIGPIALALMVITGLTALYRKSVSYWHVVHLLNYAVLAILFVKVLIIGTDLRQLLWLDVVFYVYIAVAAAGLVYRAGKLLLQRRRRALRLAENWRAPDSRRVSS
jgi:hypothetical protein